MVARTHTGKISPLWWSEPQGAAWGLRFCPLVSCLRVAPCCALKLLL